jgi:hypothetical protein
VARFALVCLALAACGDDAAPGECAAGAKSLAFLAPVDGASLTMADDTNPDMALLQIDFRARACGIDPLLDVGIYMLEPTATSYAFTSAGDGILIFTDISLIPGTLRFELRSVEATPVVSTPITIDVMF